MRRTVLHHTGEKRAGGIMGWHRHLRLYICVVVVLFVTCRDTFVEAIFVRPPTKTIPYPSLSLATADLLRVPYKGIAYDAGKEASLPSFALSLNAEFGPLDTVTFLGLQDLYCGWSETKSRVKWIEGEKYTLLDFLPPLCQAVNGLYFRSSRKKLAGLPSFLGGPEDKVKKRTEQEVLLTSNCWGFAWEIVRQHDHQRSCECECYSARLGPGDVGIANGKLTLLFHSPSLTQKLYQADNADVFNMQISTADPKSAWKAFTNPKFFDLIQSSRAYSKLLTDPKIRNKRLRGGDTLLIWHQIKGQSLYLDHVAILLDDDVYYEKSGSGDNVPFRISTWEGITANFPPGIFYWEWRRLVRNRVVPGLKDTSYRLGSASETFSVDKQVKKGNLSERFKILKDLRPSVSQGLSLQTENDDEGGVEANMYTGIYVLEDLVFDRRTGRASLPMSAFTDVMLPELPENPYKRKSKKK